MELGNGYRPKNEIKIKRPNREMIGSNSDTLLVIKLPTSMVLRILSRSLFLAMFILALPSIGSFLRGSSRTLYDHNTIGSSSIDADFVPLLFHDLAKDGLVNEVDRALVLSSEFERFADYFGLFEENDIDLVIESDLGNKSMISDESFDCVFALSSRDIELEDRVLKIGGILVAKLNDDPSNAFQQLPNYKIVYVRRFNSTIIAMRKTSSSNKRAKIEKKANICGPSEAKKAASQGLEDPFFEPPTSRELAKSTKIKFLADFLGNSLESYKRRIFVTDENEKDGVLRWFHQSYPTKRQHFEEIKTGGLTDWVKRNVKEEDFVVVKAEAQTVEEMMRDKTICLVDELFLECEFQKQGVSEGKRAYWQCLALLGNLRDEGISVHQWWG